MRVLFFLPLIKYNVDTAPAPLGVLAICSYLRLHSDHDTFIVDRSTDRRSIPKFLKEIKPDIVGVSVKSNLCIADAQKISQATKTQNIPVIWGGEFPSTCPEIVLKEDYVDMVGVGEGEKTCLELLDALNSKNVELNKIDGLVYKSGNEIIKNNERVIMPAEELARVDYDLVDVDQYVTPLYGCKKMIWNYAAKGCPGECTFCFNKSFHKRQYRKRNYDDILAEIGGLAHNHGVDGIFFGDELWCKSIEEMRSKCDMITDSGLNFFWGCYLRVGILNVEDYVYMYNAGCRWIVYGIESGSPERLKKIKKHASVENAEESVRDCYLSGICPISSFIIGFPDETVEELKMSTDLMKSLSKYSQITCSRYSPYIGSELYDNLIESGRLKQFENINELSNTFFWDTLFGKDDINISDIPKIDLKVITAYLNLKAFFGQANADKKHAALANKPVRQFLTAVKTFLTGFRWKNLHIYFKLFLDISHMYLFSFYYVLFYRKTKAKYQLSFRSLFE